VTQRSGEHNRLILDQFTKQAAPFAEMPAHSEETAMKLLLDVAQPRPEDDALDVACGPGLVACALAPYVRHVTGIDLTPAMIDQARARQESLGLGNLSWRIGEAEDLPFEDCSFSLVLTRYSFHHLLNPLAALREMARACAPDGRILVIDVAAEPEKVESYNRMERLRDPSHVSALTRREFQRLGEDAGLRLERSAFYRLETPLERILAASFPNPGDEETLRRMVTEDLGKDRLGVGAFQTDDGIRIAFPIGIFAYRR
jgi:SAM-dependent methyltransferase